MKIYPEIKDLDTFTKKEFAVALAKCIGCDKRTVEKYWEQFKLHGLLVDTHQNGRIVMIDDAAYQAMCNGGLKA